MLNIMTRAGAGTLYAAHIGSVRSYDHLGRPFSWTPPMEFPMRRAALDVEAKHHPSAARLCLRYGLLPEAFLKRWTASEALAKILDQPILDFIRSKGLAPEAPDRWTPSVGDVWVRGLAHPTHWITVAIIPERLKAGRTTA